MNKPPIRFTVLAVLALLWNIAGLLAIGADLSLSTSEIAALPQDQQTLRSARPVWSVIGSVVAVTTGTLGCILLLLRRRAALWAFSGSLLGIVLQDIGLFLFAGAAQQPGSAVIAMQTMVAVVGVSLLLFSHKAIRSSWLK